MWMRISNGNRTVIMSIMAIRLHQRRQALLCFFSTTVKLCVLLRNWQRKRVESGGRKRRINWPKNDRKNRGQKGDTFVCPTTTATQNKINTNVSQLGRIKNRKGERAELDYKRSAKRRPDVCVCVCMCLHFKTFSQLPPSITVIGQH